MSIQSRTLSLLAGVALSLASATAVAETASPGYENGSSGAPSGAAMAVDLVVARPLGLVATVLGTVVFVAALPFELLAGNVADPARKLVVEPAAYTFTRPLGEDVN